MGVRDLHGRADTDSAPSIAPSTLETAGADPYPMEKHVQSKRGRVATRSTSA